MTRAGSVLLIHGSELCSPIKAMLGLTTLTCPEPALPPSDPSHNAPLLARKGVLTGLTD